MDESDKDNILAKWLDGSLDEVEKAQFKKSGELDDLRRLMDDMEHWSLPAMDIQAKLSELRSIRQEKKQKQVFFSNWTRMAAVFLVLAASYFVFGPWSSQVEINTGVGQQLSHMLPDGSEVTLGAMSQLSYSKRDWKKNRKLNFEGTGYFDVEKGASFEVNSSYGSVKVLGTAFVIISNEQEYQVTCFEGSVAVNVAGEEQILKPQDQYMYSKGRKRVAVTAATQPDWTQGYYKYNNAALSTVVIDLKKQYVVKIDLPEHYEDIKFTGKVYHNNLGNALRTIFTPLEIDFSLEDGSTVIFN